MEPFIVSARKYRPQTFKDVVGQEAITNTLTNAIEHNHLAQALLFCGPRGVGKTTCARILAKKINHDGSQGEDEDFAFNIFELDAASNNSVDDIRSLIDQVRIPPQVGKYKVYIIDEVHMLSSAAFNAFLKTLEEPPKHAIFILATTEKHKIIPTILSRCQIFDFKRITVKDAAAYLKYIAENQGIDAEEDALHIIAQKADGAMRDALSIFDRVVSFSGNKLTRKAVTENLNVLDHDCYFTATDLVLERNVPQLLLLFNETLANGFEGHHFITGLASHFRDLLVCQHESTIPLLEVGENTQLRYLAQSKKTSPTFLVQALDLANACDLNYKSSKNQRLLVELSLLKMASIDFDGEKKNPESVALSHKTIEFIAPASFFRELKLGNGHSVVQKEVTVIGNIALKKPATREEPTVLPTPQIEAAVAHQPPQIALDTTNLGSLAISKGTNRFSALSISGIKAKKEHELGKKDVDLNEGQLPNEAFTEAAMQGFWAEFVDKIEQEGRKILASILHSDTPKLIDQTIIAIQLPNDTMKKEIEREQFGLLEYLKTRLNNHFIELRITVSEEVAQKYAFTPQEKYEKLREKNPVIDLLRKEFDLDF